MVAHPVLGPLTRELLRRVDPEIVMEEAVLPVTRVPGGWGAGWVWRAHHCLTGLWADIVGRTCKSKCWSAKGDRFTLSLNLAQWLSLAVHKRRTPHLCAAEY